MLNTIIAVLRLGPVKCPLLLGFGIKLCLKTFSFNLSFQAMHRHTMTVEILFDSDLPKALFVLMGL